MYGIGFHFTFIGNDGLQGNVKSETATFSRSY